jgi:hypothetical protein
MVIIVGAIVCAVLVIVACVYAFQKKTEFTMTITVMNKDKKYNKKKDHDEHYTYFVTSSGGETFQVISYSGGFGDQDMLLWNKFVVNSTYKVKGYGVGSEVVGITRTITEILS